MELINNDFVKINKGDFFSIMTKSAFNDEGNMFFLRNLIETIMEYEDINNTRVNDLYISRDYIIKTHIANESELSVTRNSILNAALFAINSDDIEKAIELRKYFSKCKMYRKDNSKLFDYILEHSMDLNELFYGEKTRLIYNIKNNKLELGYVYSAEGNSKKLKS